MEKPTSKRLLFCIGSQALSEEFKLQTSECADAKSFKLYISVCLCLSYLQVVPLTIPLKSSFSFLENI